MEKKNKENRGLRKLRHYKNDIMEAIISDEELVQAIHNNNPVFTSEKVKDPASLLYKQIFPYKWTAPEVPTRKEVYITMSFDASRMQGGIFNDITFTLYVMVHKDIMRIDTGSDYMLRSDFIVEKLEDIFHESLGFGTGRLQLIDTFEIFVNPLLPAFGLTFKTVDQAGRE